jgi:hypothetical protein
MLSKVTRDRFPLSQLENSGLPLVGDAKEEPGGGRYRYQLIPTIRGVAEVG